ncbi:autotransporter outer membrane beta-barrel domain-containing protein [Aliarcobacter lanthieri]|uniref:autotransporter family protein n=1 Tax=Aliarcobacter lanthieri TaxID=1355374 RepID=UPI003AA847E7
MENNIKFRNRFKILKGGKISLVVSSMLISVSLVSEVKAAPSPCVSINDLKTTTQYLCNNNLTIESTGSIIGIDKGIDTMFVDFGDNIIDNKGLISVNDNSYSTGINISLGEDSSLTLTNSGNVLAYKNGELDRNAYSLNLGSHYGDQNIIVNNSGILKGNMRVVGKLINNSGLVELPYNAKYDNDTDAYIKDFENSSVLRIGLKTDGTMEGTEYSQLTTQNTLFKEGSTIYVNILDNSTNVELLAGARLENVIRANNSLIIDGELKLKDNSALLDFKYVTSDTWINGEDGAIHLDVVKSSSNNILDNTISGGGKQNEQRAAVALQSLYDNNSDVAVAFNKLQTDVQIANAVESTTPISTNSTVTAGTQISNGISSIVTQRQNANITGSGLNSGDGMFSENNLWIKPFGSIGKQSNKDGINGFDLKTYGLGFGADSEYKDNQRVGLAFFYTNGSVDTNGVSQKADLDVFTTLVYGNIPIIDDKTNFLYQIGYSWQKTDTKRDIGFIGQTAEAKYTSKIASIDLKLMRDINVSDNLLLQPLVNTTYRHFTNPSYSESGAGALNLDIDKFTTSELILGLGTIAHYKLTNNSKLIGSLNVGYDLQDKAQIVNSAYQGANGVKFGTNGIDNGRWNYEVGIGYELDINSRNNINISYDYQGQGTKFSNNVISAKYVLKF